MDPHGRPMLAVPTVLSSYNISLNFSSILAMIPGSRLLARFRRRRPFQTPLEQTAIPVTETILDDWSADPSTVTLVVETDASATMVTEQLPSSLPGPWGFFTSGYMLGLLVMVRHLLPHSQTPAYRLSTHRPFYSTACRTSSFLPEYLLAGPDMLIAIIAFDRPLLRRFASLFIVFGPPYSRSTFPVPPLVLPSICLPYTFSPKCFCYGSS